MTLTIGQRIKQARQAKGLSQTDLAAQTNVSQPTVANWENGAHAPRHGVLSKVSDILDAPQSWLLGEGQAADINSPTQNNHHIPVLSWPQSRADLDCAPVDHYISATTSAARPIALINQDSSVLPIGASIIFDRADQTLIEGGVYLCEGGSADHGLTLERYEPNKKPLQPIARAVLVQNPL